MTFSSLSPVPLRNKIWSVNKSHAIGRLYELWPRGSCSSCPLSGPGFPPALRCQHHGQDSKSSPGNAGSAEFRRSRVQATSWQEGKQSWCICLYQGSLLPLFSIAQGSGRPQGDKAKEAPPPPPTGEQGRNYLGQSRGCWLAAQV